MAREHNPVKGQWYDNLEDDDSFQVLSIDEDAELIEIQYVDGDIEEIDYETWHELTWNSPCSPKAGQGRRRKTRTTTTGTTMMMKTTTMTTTGTMTMKTTTTMTTGAMATGMTTDRPAAAPSRRPAFLIPSK